MRNKIICGFLVLHVVALACSPKKEEKSKSEEQQVNEYPDLVLTFENGQQLPAKRLQGNNVFVLFQPDCDHCQQEAIHIEQHLEEFKNYNIYFISSSSMQQIIAFAENFHLKNKRNVKFTWTSTEGVLNHYGAIQTPSVYIYSDGKLKHSFNGQTDIENILSAL